MIHFTYSLTSRNTLHWGFTVTVFFFFCHLELGLYSISEMITKRVCFYGNNEAEKNVLPFVSGICQSAWQHMTVTIFLAL